MKPDQLSRGLGLGLLLFIVAGLVACPEGSKKVLSSKKTKAAEIQSRLDRVDVQYEILLTFRPPQEETLPFREKVVEAKKALDNKDYARADQLARESEAWLQQNQDKYYQDYPARIVAGTAKESGGELMNKARLFMDRALAAQNQNDQWTFDQYSEAAIETGELGLLVQERTPEQAVTLIQLHKQMQVLYQNAGKTDLAKESQARVFAYLDRVLQILDVDVKEKIAGKRKGYTPQELGKKPENFPKAEKALRDENALRLQIAGEARGLDPNRFRAQDYTGSIDKWSQSWQGYFANPNPLPPLPIPSVTPDYAAEIKARLEVHNQIKLGAVPVQGTGIVLEELQIYTMGGDVFIRGQLRNMLTVPIYNPRVVITGQLMSEVIDLGYDKFNPLITTTFHIPIEGFTAEAFMKRRRLPPHELLLIYQESPGGPERKVYAPGKF